MHEARAVGGLVDLIDDPDLFVRRAAIFALREIGDRRAIQPMLEEFARLVSVKPPDPNTLNYLQWALCDLGEHVEPWFDRYRDAT